MTIHDFDMARYVTGSDVVEVFARGAVRIDRARRAGRRRHGRRHARARERLPHDHRQQPPRGLRLRPAGRGVRRSRHGRLREPGGTRASCARRTAPAGPLALLLPRALHRELRQREWGAFVDAVRRGLPRHRGRRPRAARHRPGGAALAARGPPRAVPRSRQRAARRHRGIRLRRQQRGEGVRRAPRRRVLARRRRGGPDGSSHLARRAASSSREARPDAIVHTAILNDLDRLYADRRAAWDAYVGATRNARRCRQRRPCEGGPRLDRLGLRRHAGRTTEDTPPNPINLYGVLKAGSELVVPSVGARGGRRPDLRRQWRALGAAPAASHAGRGLRLLRRGRRRGARRGEPFTVWESDEINMIATPSLASHSAELMLMLADRRLTGVFHCAAASRRRGWGWRGQGRGGLRARCEPAPKRTSRAGELLLAPIPYDTTLDARHRGCSRR